jgi:hypothetical protein
VFVDVRRDTLNLDETLLEKHIAPRTRAIVAVHYAGVRERMTLPPVGVQPSGCQTPRQRPKAG